MDCRVPFDHLHHRNLGTPDFLHFCPALGGSATAMAQILFLWNGWKLWSLLSPESLWKIEPTPARREIIQIWGAPSFCKHPQICWHFDSPNYGARRGWIGGRQDGGERCQDGGGVAPAPAIEKYCLGLLRHGFHRHHGIGCLESGKASLNFG